VKPSVVALRARTLLAVSDTAARGYGIGRVRAARVALRLRRRNGFDVEGALLDGLLDPTMDDSTRYAHIGRTKRRAAQDRLNPPSLEPFSEQKLVFHDYCRAGGLPVPEVYGTLGAAGGWDRRAGVAIGGGDAFAAFLEGLPGDVVIKPSFGNRGGGIRMLRRGERGFVDLRGAAVDVRALHDEIRAGDVSDVHLVQERLRNHPAIEEISGSPVLQTLRLITIVRPDGSVFLLTAVLKLALGTADIDNFLGGRTGNGYALVTQDDGRLGNLMRRAPEGYGLTSTPVVPRTGVRVAGRPVPFFEEAVAVARRAAVLMLPMRTLGWDMAITPSGPVILEANHWWAPFEPLPAEGWALLTGDP
jgi:hypothetical protein